MIVTLGYHERQLEREQQRHDREIERLHAMYAKIIESQASAIEKVFNLANFGTASRPEATSAEGDTTAPQRLARVIDEDTVNRAVDALRAQYKDIGIELPDSELEAEARSLVMGTGFVPGETLRERLAVG
ncbi:MAG TPA: hypothetical protein VL333_13035 [Candidatus Saccharimonadales bacterium]|nr:hypothetical protein [Candidatus Saccharimonadales bacterium]